MKLWMIVSGIVALVALTVLFLVTAPSDEQLIREAIEESTTAASEGRPSEVLDYLSRNLTFNGQPIFERDEIAKWVRLAKPEVAFADYSPAINGDQATVVADVNVKFNFQGYNVDQVVPGVEVKLARESGLRWLVLPGAQWRITDVSAPDLAQFSTGLE
jgi:hypothetical protein